MEKVNTKVWESKDRAIDAQSSVKSAVALLAGIDNPKLILAYAEKFYQFIQSKRSSQIDSVEIPE